MTLWHPSRLTPAQLEERRLQAAKLLRAGHLFQAEVTRRVGISRTTVGRWAAILTRRGLRGLRRRPHTGRPPRLTAARWRRVAEDRRDCFWLYVVTDCDNAPRLQEPIRDPARLDWNEVTKVAHYYVSVNAMTKPMQVREQPPHYGRSDD